MARSRLGVTAASDRCEAADCEVGGDVFVVNKSDRKHAERYANDLRSILELTSGERDWVPRVVGTVAVKGEGIDELMELIDAHRAFLGEGDRLEEQRVESLRNRVVMVVDEKMKDLFWQSDAVKVKLEGMLSEVVAGKKSPYQAAHELLSIESCMELSASYQMPSSA